jgi:nucleotidyltransferase substrate binding protein (TIGR01987 family)
MQEANLGKMYQLVEAPDGGTERGIRDMNEPDIRWKQRFSNFNKALLQLSKAVELSQQRPLSDLERQGLIKAYEFVYELAWNVMKDYFTFQGAVLITGSREAFRRELIVDGDAWMDMVRDRNKTAHTYDEAVAKEVVGNVTQSYYPLFIAFQRRMQELQDAN